VKDRSSVDFTLDLDADCHVNVHLSDAQLGILIACGT